MKLTKFQHACFVIEKEGTAIVVDPGAYTHDFITPHKVDAIVITHDHPDHFDETLINKILQAHPKATILAHETISGRFSNYSAVAAKLNEPHTIGTITMQFFGGEHASISPTMPVPQNYGVLFDNHLYYPGDSFAAPEGFAVSELALPVSAPWLKLNEVMNFFSYIKPQIAFPTHDAILSDDGKRLVDQMLGIVASGQNSQYKRLDGQTIEL